MTDETDIPAPPPTRSITSRLRTMLVTVTVLVLIWVGLSQIVTPMMLGKNKAPQPIENDLEARVKTLEEKIGALEEKPATAATDTTLLEERIAALEAVKPSEEEPIKKEDVDALSEKLGGLNAQMEAIKTEQQANVTAVLLLGELRTALQEGRPYAAQLGALKELRPALTDVLAPLQTNADTGVATLAQLQAQFTAAINPALQPKKSDVSFVQNLRSLVQVRKVGASQRGKDDEAIIARAEAKLAQANITDALAEIEGLSTQSAPAFSGWVARVKAKLAAENALAQLQKNIITPAAGAAQ